MAAKNTKTPITPGTVCIILKGKHAGKRVVLLKTIKSGNLLVTGPRKINTVSLAKITPRHVIVTSTKIDLGDFKLVDTVEEKFLKPRKLVVKDEVLGIDKDKTKKSVKPMGWRKTKNKINKHVARAVNSMPDLTSYLQSVFSLRKGEYPHEMKF